MIAGAFVHYHGITLLAVYRLKNRECPLETVDTQCLIDTVHNQTSAFATVVN